MSGLAKVFLVINLVLAVIFLGTSATLFAVRKDYKEQMTKMAKEYCTPSSSRPAKFSSIDDRRRPVGMSGSGVGVGVGNGVGVGAGVAVGGGVGVVVGAAVGPAVATSTEASCWGAPTSAVLALHDAANSAVDAAATSPQVFIVLSYASA